MDRPNRNDKYELHNGEIVPMYNNRTYTEALEKYASTLEEQLTSTDRELLLDFADYSEIDKTSQTTDECVDNYLDSIK